MTYQHNDYASEFRSRAGAWWDRAVSYAAGIGPPPTQPYQVELHPSLVGAPVCLLRCVDCHGQFHRTVDGLSKETYLQLLEDLAGMNVQALVLSGAYSDPTTDEDLLVSILDRSGPRWGVRLHTYGLGLTPTLREAILWAASSDPTHQSYLSISKVTTDPGIYFRMCRPPSNDPEACLRLEHANLSALFQESRGVPITLRLNCRLTKVNGTERHLTELLEWFSGTPDNVHIRFTTDYVPTGSTLHYRERFMRDVYLSPGDASTVLRNAMTTVGFKDTHRVSFRDAGATRYESLSCYNSLLFSTVSTAGGVFPCQGIASRAYESLAYGDLNVERFPTIWNRFIRGYYQHPIMTGCPRCVASCERQINTAIDSELGNE